MTSENRPTITVTDLTGARHTFEAYDAMAKLRAAERLRPLKPVDPIAPKGPIGK